MTSRIGKSPVAGSRDEPCLRAASRHRADAPTDQSLGYGAPSGNARAETGLAGTSATRPDGPDHEWKDRRQGRRHAGVYMLGYHQARMSPIRSDVVGSLLRPPYLIKAREAHEAGRMTAAEF